MHEHREAFYWQNYYKSSGIPKLKILERAGAKTRWNTSNQSSRGEKRYCGRVHTRGGTKTRQCREYLQLMTYFNRHCGRVHTRGGTKTRQCREYLQLMTYFNRHCGRVHTRGGTKTRQCREYLQLMTYFNRHCGRVHTRGGTKTRQCRENLQLMILMQQALEQSTHSRRDWNKTLNS